MKAPDPPKAWQALCAAWAAVSLLAWPLPRAALDWQPQLAAMEPWRAVTAAFVHWTPLHLAANLAGCAVLALLGHRARLEAGAALAGVIALPLTQLALLLRPELAHYAGLSGALHALVAIAALHLLQRRGRERWIGLGMALGLGLKIALEAPLGPVLRHTPEFDFAVAPFAHLAGTLAGLLAGALTMRRPDELKRRTPHGT